MLNLWNRISEELENDRPVFLAVVVGHEKGSPGTESAQLLVTEGGESLGTIGGGIMEARLLEEANEALQGEARTPVLRVLHHKQTDKREVSGLICGGAQSMVTAVLDSRYRPLVADVCERLKSGKEGTVTFSSAGITLGDEDLDQPSAFVTGEGDDWMAHLGLFNRRRLLIVGCGHCGSALARQMMPLDFHVTVVEPRTDLPGYQELPEGIEVVNNPYTEAGKFDDHARLTFAVVMTPSYSDDVDAVAGLLPHPFPFIGVMGSPVKLKKIKEELLNRGFAEADWNRLTAPVGLSIDSDTPAEIAVSIAAQVVQKVKVLNL